MGIEYDYGITEQQKLADETGLDFCLSLSSWNKQVE
jgi:hypothetical protein